MRTPESCQVAVMIEVMRRNLQLDLKHSCEQKKEPLMPSLERERMRKEGEGREGEDGLVACGTLEARRRAILDTGRGLAGDVWGTHRAHLRCSAAGSARSLRPQDSGLSKSSSGPSGLSPSASSAPTAPSRVNRRPDISTYSTANPSRGSARVLLPRPTRTQYPATALTPPPAAQNPNHPFTASTVLVIP